MADESKQVIDILIQIRKSLDSLADLYEAIDTRLESVESELHYVTRTHPKSYC